MRKRLVSAGSVAGAIALIAGSLWSHSQSGQLLFICLLLFSMMVFTRKFRPLYVTLGFALPALVMSVIVHGFANPAFLVSGNIYLFGTEIGYRLSGLEYALEIALRFLALGVGAAFLRETSLHSLIRLLTKFKLSPSIIAAITQVAHTFVVASRKIQQVYLAQQARGLRVGPDIAHRAKAIPSVVIPVTIATLLDVEQRADAMQARGFGLFPLQFASEEALESSLPLSLFFTVIFICTIWV